MIHFTRVQKMTNELEGTVPGNTTKTDIVIDAEILSGTRVIFGKVYRLEFLHDGTVADATIRMHRMCSISNDMFRDFSEIQKGIED